MKILTCLLQQLNKTSIIVDASKYIVELKQKVERLNQDIEEFPESSTTQSPLPAVREYLD